MPDNAAVKLEKQLRTMGQLHAVKLEFYEL